MVFPVKASLSVDFLKYILGLVPAATLTPEASVIVAFNTGNVVQNVLFSNIVNVIVGAEKSLGVPANSTAPQSGVEGLVIPKISVVTEANGTALLSAKLVPVGAYIPVETKAKLFPE